MARFTAFAALVLCKTVAGQVSTSTIVEGGINPTDIENLPTPTALGPPIGDVQRIDILTYDAASVTASVLSAALTATSIATDVSATSDVSTAGATLISAASLGKRHIAVQGSSIVGRRSSIISNRRDYAYPIKTSNTAAPNEYTPAFVNLQSATQASGYLTYKTFANYNATACAAACDKISSCKFFNIYYEKDPDINNNPVDVMKCSLYSIPQTNATATNFGQWRGTFHIIITGSNGYNKAAPLLAPAGYSIDVYNEAAVNAPLRDSAGQWRFIQPVYLSEYSPSLCAAACDSQSVYDQAHFDDGCNFHACVYVNLYILSEDGKSKTVVCALYTEPVNSTYAIVTAYSTPDHYYQVSNSIALTNTTAAALYPTDPHTCSAPSSFYLQMPVDAGTAFDGEYIKPLNNTGYQQFGISPEQSDAGQFSLDTSGYLIINQQQIFQAALPGLQLIESTGSANFLSSMSQLVCKGNFLDFSCSTTNNTVFQVCEFDGSKFLAFSAEDDVYDACTKVGSTLSIVATVAD